jgi:glycosyltransferase involved in cell wall biosynthesis
MKVSIITISYNSSSTIEKTLKSVESQSYQNIEHIIIDGDSSDNTIEICNKFHHLSKIISELDNGVYDAFNKGLILASGDIIGFLNSDDVFFCNNSIQKIVNAFEDSRKDIIYGDLEYVNQKGKVIRDWISKPFKKGLMKNSWMPAHPTFYCKKEVYENFGVYNDSFKIAGDFDLCLRFLEVNNVSSFYLNEKLIKMLTGGISNKGIKSKLIVFVEQIEALKLNGIEINFLNILLFKTKKITQYINLM